MHSNAYNMIMMITIMFQSPFRTVYIYFLEGVTQPSRALSDTILPVDYNIELTNNKGYNVYNKNTAAGQLS